MVQKNDSQPNWPSLTFQLNLETLQRLNSSLPYNRTLIGNELTSEADAMKTTRSSWLCSLLPGMEFVAGKDGFRFTAKGFKAVYYKNLYVKGSPDDLLRIVSS